MSSEECRLATGVPFRVPGAANVGPSEQGARSGNSTKDGTDMRNQLIRDQLCIWCPVAVMLVLALVTVCALIAEMQRAPTSAAAVWRLASGFRRWQTASPAWAVWVRSALAAPTASRPKPPGPFRGHGEQGEAAERQPSVVQSEPVPPWATRGSRFGSGVACQGEANFSVASAVKRCSLSACSRRSAMESTVWGVVRVREDRNRGAQAPRLHRLPGRWRLRP